MKTRAEHLQWCKDRALEYSARGDYQNALASMMSDIDKHPETQGHKGNEIGTLMLLNGMLNNRADVDRFINGYN